MKKIYSMGSRQMPVLILAVVLLHCPLVQDITCVTGLRQPFYTGVIVMLGGPAPLLLQEQAMHSLQQQNGIIHTSTDPASLAELDIMIREQDILSVL